MSNAAGVEKRLRLRALMWSVMPSDKREHPPRTRAEKKRDEARRMRRRSQSSSDEDDCGSGSDDGGGPVDMEEYRRFLSQLFPSKHMEEKVRAMKGKKRGRAAEARDDAEGQAEEEEEGAGQDSGSDDSDSDWEEEDDEEEMDSEDEAALAEAMGNARFNIIFTMGQGSDSESDGESGTDSEAEESETEEVEEDDTPRRRAKGKSARSAPAESSADAACEEKVVSKLKAVFDGLSPEEKEAGIVKELLHKYEALRAAKEKAARKAESKERTKNSSSFKKLLREKNVMNDVRFFKEQLAPAEQRAVLAQMKEIREHCDIEKPYRLTLLDAKIPVQYKACAYNKISTLKYMEPGGGEYYKIKNWVDAFMRIPFGVHRSLPLTLDDGVDKCHAFMEAAKQTLDEAVYGLDDAKLQIMQMVGQWVTNPAAVGTAIAIKGPMGTGKTTLVKEGISKILGRDFAFIALGGATDSSFLEGHSYTYEGSTWGKVVEILLQSRSMNPVIYFDELDKVSETPKGEEITGILTHLTDTSQNSKFHDKYFAEIDFDLSRCLFIFSYNDEEKVNPILRDRMYRIQTKGYSAKEKVEIARDYLMPRIREQVKFDEGEILIDEDTMKHVVDKHTGGEQGVRNLKRCLEIIHTKLNLYRLMKPGSNLFAKDMDLTVEFPFTVTAEVVDKLIRSEKKAGSWAHMYM